MKRRCMTAIIACAGIVTANAQYVTYNHDADKMNQITVMEIGSGSLSPEYYYWLFHNKYKGSANETNKLGYRTAAGVAAFKQVPMSESIDSAMTKRAKIEALNIADRSGGALDLAWKTEGEKITTKLETYRRNIDRIIGAGGTRDNQARWLEHYNMYTTAIKATQDAYMPNAERKKQYLAIYADIAKDNVTLVEYIVRLNNANRTNGLLNSSSHRSDPRARAATAALNRWREAGWKTVHANRSAD